MSARRRRKREKEGIRIGRWTVEALLAGARIAGRGPASECDGFCCRHGVHASMAARDRILEYAERVKETMDDTQTRDVRRWFDPHLHEDDDFPGGLCVGTATYRNKCVFLNGDGLCVLQILEPNLDLPPGERLKPHYCFLFPIVTCGPRVEYDDMNDGDRSCCTLTRNGVGTPALDALEFELRFVLGDEGYETLRRSVLETPAARRLPKQHGRSNE